RAPAIAGGALDVEDSRSPQLVVLVVCDEREDLGTRLLDDDAVLCRRHRVRLTRDEGPGEVLRVERPQILELLAHADQLDRQPELVRDRDRDAALRTAVELRECDARDADGLAEEARLLEAVL